MQGDELRILESYLRGKGLKLTKARQIVLMAFLGLEEHVNADMVYEAAKQIDPGIGQATVFRTLRLLEDAGLAREASRKMGPGVMSMPTTMPTMIIYDVLLAGPL